MVAITSINSATPSIQAALGRARLAQAQREAEQAEANAKDLRAQADQAEQESTERQNNVRRVASSQAREGTTYAAPSTRKAAGEAVRVQSSDTEQQNRSDDNAKPKPSTNPLGIYTSAATTAGGRDGKVPGRIVNVSA
ncbi:MAG: hypothetical protein IPH35_22195 [Rhodoferax sp.]|nr:hypothetical protein [Rhodoferax sp.]